MRQRRDAGAARCRRRRATSRAGESDPRTVPRAARTNAAATRCWPAATRIGSVADESRAAAVRDRRRGPRLVVEQRDPLAVDRDVDVLEAARCCPEFNATSKTYSPSAGKTWLTTMPAARAVRRALDVIPRMLRRVAGVGVGRVVRRRVAIADRHAADRGRRVQVRLEQRRRERLHVGDVVEVRALGVERQVVAGVDLERRAGRGPRARTRRG